MKLLTKEIKKSLPELGATEGTDAEVKVKFFTPWSNWTWYVLDGCGIIEVGNHTEEVSLKDVIWDMRGMWYRGPSRTVPISCNKMPKVQKSGDSTGEIEGELRLHERGEKSLLAWRDAKELGVRICTSTRTPECIKGGICEKGESGLGKGNGSLSGKGGTHSSHRREQAKRFAGELGTADTFATHETSFNGDQELALQGRAPLQKVIDVLFFGLVDGNERELGYFSLSELAALRGPWGLKVERDLYFGNPKLSEV